MRCRKDNQISKMKEKKFSYKSQYGIIVLCSDEKEQERIYNELLKQGLKLKVVCV